MKIERGIPIPGAPARVGRPAKYPYQSMEPGDSVFIAGGKIGGPAYSSALQTGARKGWKFVGRKEDGGIRIWRIE